MDSPRADVRKRIASSVVRDSRTGDVIIKLVNLLPVPVKTTVNCPDIDGQQAVLKVLSGEPADRQAKPVQGTLTVSERFDYEMPAYSLSVVRITDKE